MKTALFTTLLSTLVLLGLAGCSPPAECCCCYYVDEFLNAECAVFSAEELGSTLQQPCGDPDDYPEPYDRPSFICGYSEDTMNVADQYQAAADTCVAELEP